MSNSNISTRRKQKPPELPEVEGFQSEKIVSLKNKRKSYIGKITKTINRITVLIDKQADFSSIDSCNKPLENYIKNIRKLTTEITQSEQNDSILQKELDICMEAQFRIIQIRNAMSAYIENKNVSPMNLDKKEHLQTISFENTLNANSQPNVNLFRKIGNNESLPDLKSELKSKPDSNRLRSSSSKASSKSSSNSLTSSYGRGTYETFSSSSRRTLKTQLKTFRKIVRA